MTRSLGDFYAQQFGLSWRPSITVRRFRGHHKKDEPESKEQEELRVANGIARSGREDEETEYTIVVASDGIWDCWKYDDFTEYMNDTLRDVKESVKEAVERVLQESVKRAKANFGVKNFDDASLIGWRISV
jgi:serine/threonine protein phosphatase PrpC